MPYIKKSEREDYEGDIESLAQLMEGEPSGHLNYIVTMLVKSWLGDEPNYTRYNEAIGVLESAKLELYRRGVAPYEDGKIKENGDVYP